MRFLSMGHDTSTASRRPRLAQGVAGAACLVGLPFTQWSIVVGVGERGTCRPTGNCRHCVQHMPAPRLLAVRAPSLAPASELRCFHARERKGGGAYASPVPPVGGSRPPSGPDAHAYATPRERSLDPTQGRSSQLEPRGSPRQNPHCTSDTSRGSTHQASREAARATWAHGALRALTWCA